MAKVKHTEAQKKAKEKGTRKSRTLIDFEDTMVLLELEGLARDGYDDQQLAEIIGITKDAFSRNKVKIKEDGSPSDLAIALRRGRRPNSVLVENSLFRRATGMTVKSSSVITRWMVLPDGTQTDTEIVQKTETNTELPPDTGAAAFWLKTHKPDIYNVKQKPAEPEGGKGSADDLPTIGTIKHVNIGTEDIKREEVDNL